VHVEATRQPYAGRLELFAANHSRDVDEVPLMARILF
jgi:hypothetical protein